MKRLLLLPLLLAALAGCLSTGCHSDGKTQEPSSAGSSMPSSEPDVPVVANVSKQSPADSRPIIIAFGDSLTAGYGTNEGQSYPDALQRDLDAKGYQYRVLNEGVSGNTTKDGVARLPSVLALHPQIVIVAFGGNDGLRGLPIASTRQNLATIITAIQHAGARVVLGGITLPPNYGPDYIQQFNETYALLSKQFRAPLLPFLLQGVYGVPGGMQDDGIHATASGNQTVARNILPLLLPLLKKH